MLVQTDSLTKQYGSIIALSECCLGVESSEVFGLLGPNGAGKTTLLRLLLGFIRPSSGKALIDGKDCYRDSVRVHRRLSYLPGEARLFHQMRGRAALRFFTRVHPAGDWKEALRIAEQLQLDLTRLVPFMSTGMRQKLGLAATLSRQVPLIVLDEPTSNLDPTVRGIVTEIIRQRRQQGTTVIFSSHVLSEVEEACDRVCILREGKLVHTQMIADLRRRHRIHLRLRNPLPDVPPGLRDQVQIQKEVDHETVLEANGDLSAVLGWLSSLSLEEIRVEPIQLRAVYDRYHAASSS